MRIRRMESGEYEARCTRCREWKPATTAYFYRSTAWNRGEVTQECDLYRELNANEQGDTSAWRSQCRVCERSRTRRVASVAASPTGRYFGVEMELTGPSYQTIVDALAAAGIRVAGPNSYHHTNRTDDAWELKRDGSVHGAGLELVSPKLRGDAGFAMLRTVCTALQSVGATVDRSTGLHVHVDFSGMDLDAIRAQLLPMVRNQGNIFRMMAPSRRSNGYCGWWTEAQTTTFANMSGRTLQHVGPRGVVNLGAFPVHGSIEFRSHGGSTSFAKISAWVRFLLAALDKNKNAARSGRAVPTFASPAEWLESLGTSVEDRDQLLRFERAAEAAMAQVERAEG